MDSSRSRGNSPIFAARRIKIQSTTCACAFAAAARCRRHGEVDSSPLWRELRHIPKKLFRRLGALRDAQIMGDWVKAHGAENDRLRLVLEAHFVSREPRLLHDAVRAAENSTKNPGSAWTTNSVNASGSFQPEVSLPNVWLSNGYRKRIVCTLGRFARTSPIPGMP